MEKITKLIGNTLTVKNIDKEIVYDKNGVPIDAAIASFNDIEVSYYYFVPFIEKHEIVKTLKISSIYVDLDKNDEVIKIELFCDFEKVKEILKTEDLPEKVKIALEEILDFENIEK